MSTVKAFAPANISCVFKICEHKNPRFAGSLGFGFTLKEGVTAEISRSKSNKIFFNDKEINFPTVRKVISSLTKEKVIVNLSSSLPLGSGFGLSGASALATAYALNKLLKLSKSKKQLAIVSHIAEVENKTGLGDVTNQYYGGMLVKFEPSSRFEVVRIPLSNIPVYCAYFSELSTKSILTNKKLTAEINKEASVVLDKMHKLLASGVNVEFENIIKLSKEFAAKSGLFTDKKTVETVNWIEENNGLASMIMLGNAVFSNTDFKGAKRLTISDQGAYVI